MEIANVVEITLADKSVVWNVNLFDGALIVAVLGAFDKPKAYRMALAINNCAVWVSGKK